MSEYLLLLRHRLFVIHALKIFGVLYVVLLVLIGDYLPDFTTWVICVKNTGSRKFTSHTEPLAGNLTLCLGILEQLVFELFDCLISLLCFHIRCVIGHAARVVQVVFIDLIYDP